LYEIIQEVMRLSSPVYIPKYPMES
jgi:hypothetical protein